MTAVVLAERSRTVADIAADSVRPLVRKIDQEGLYPDGLLRELGAAGAFAHHVSTDGNGLIAAVADMANVAEVCLSTAFCMWCQDAFVGCLCNGGAAGRYRPFQPDESGLSN
jgi:alkylation response protein AidB-like acyl-CoA dehydrogenase